MALIFVLLCLAAAGSGDRDRDGRRGNRSDKNGTDKNGTGCGKKNRTDRDGDNRTDGNWTRGRDRDDDDDDDDDDEEDEVLVQVQATEAAGSGGRGRDEDKDDRDKKPCDKNATAKNGTDGNSTNNVTMVEVTDDGMTRITVMSSFVMTDGSVHELQNNPTAARQGLETGLADGLGLQADDSEVTVQRTEPDLAKPQPSPASDSLLTVAYAVRVSTQSTGAGAVNMFLHNDSNTIMNVASAIEKGLDSQRIHVGIMRLNGKSCNKNKNKTDSEHSGGRRHRNSDREEEERVDSLGAANLIGLIAFAVMAAHA